MRRFFRILLLASIGCLLAGWLAVIPQAAQADFVARRPFGAQNRLSINTAHTPFARLFPHLALHGMAQPRAGAATPPGNFPFQTAQSGDGLVIIHFYQRPGGFAPDALATIEGYLQHPVQDTLGETLKHAINIYIYNSRADFLAGAQPDNPAETSAFTDPATSSIYLPITSVHADDANTILPHELTHIVFHQNVDVGHLESVVFRMFPLWLDEGMAEHDVPADTQGALGDTYFLAQAAGRGDTTDMFSTFLYAYPSDPSTDALEYAEARSFIGYLIDTYGAAKFHQFVSDVHAGEILLAAERAFGPDLQTLQDQWRASVGLPALGHDVGNGAPTAAAVPYVQGRVAPIVAHTTPFDVAGQDMFSTNAIRITFLLTLFAGLAMVAGWFQLLRRRQQVQAVRAAEALLAFNTSLALPDAMGTLPKRSSTPLPRLPWPEVAGIVLFAPIVLAVELIGARFNAGQEWSQSFHVAEWAAGIGILGLLVLAGLALRQQRLSLAQIGGIVIALLTLLSAALQGSAAGLAQGKAYEARGAYALATKVFTDAGVPSGDLARAQAEWGNAALTAQDYGGAVTHLRASVLAAPTQATRASLNQATLALAQALDHAQQFDQALQALQTQANSDACDHACQVLMQNGQGVTYLDWATTDFIQGQASAGLAKVAYAAQHFPSTDAGLAAKKIQAGVTTPFSSGIAASNADDILTMNVLLQLAAAQQPNGTNAATASEVPEPVTGSVQDASGSSVAGDGLYFLGFANQHDAQHYSPSKAETDITKAMTTINADGSFSVRLEPGLWYLAMWADPSQKLNHDINLSTAVDFAVFHVAPYQPTTVGTITGA